MRSIFGLALLVGLVFAFSGAARAGDFSPPVNTNACGEADVAGDAMTDPNLAYTSAATPELCVKLCGRAGSVCRVYVNDVFACYLRYLANARTFGKLNCESSNVDPAAVKLCKQNTVTAVANAIVAVKGDREEAALDCLTWRDTCQAACLAP
jgi:hypothetical protein